MFYKPTMNISFIAGLLLWSHCLCPLKLDMSSETQCDSIWRRGLWKIIRVRFSDESRAFITGLVHSEEVCPTLHALTKHRPCEDTAKRQPTVTRKRALTRNQIGQYLIFNFQHPEQWKINLGCSSHPVYRILLRRSKLTKTTLDPSLLIYILIPHQDHTVLTTIASQSVLKLGCVIPPALLFQNCSDRLEFSAMSCEVQY